MASELTSSVGEGLRPHRSRLYAVLCAAHYRSQVFEGYATNIIQRMMCSKRASAGLWWKRSDNRFFVLAQSFMIFRHIFLAARKFAILKTGY